MLRIRLHNGLTLFDLLVSISVASVLFAVAIPALDTLILDARRTTRVNNFVSAIHMAKAKAHEQRADVVICKSRDAVDCDPLANWGDGWLVFVNRDEDQPPRVDANERILWRGAAVQQGSVNGNREVFIFRPFAISSTNGTLTFCDKRGATFARAVIVSNTGRPRASPRKAGGGALDCPVL